jgi:xylulokinase
MSASVIALDLGTGGAKAAVFRDDGACVAEQVVAYETFYPSSLRHEQRPQDWWEAVRRSIGALLAAPGVDAGSIKAIALSGQSLGCIPLDDDGELLEAFAPIWSDGRAEAEANSFFASVDPVAWYYATGNGFPPPLYTIFKSLWLRNHKPEIFARTRTIIGSKDYINLRLTGRILTDQSYASGSGVYDLKARRYSPELLAAAGLDAALLPQIVASTDAVGEVLPETARALGLPQGVRVVAGGVDNSCMALGASTFEEGDSFIAMGSSSWLNVSSAAPLLDDLVKPYVFDHVAPGMYLSATSIFSSGTSLSWVRGHLPLHRAQDDDRPTGRYAGGGGSRVCRSRGMAGFLPDARPGGDDRQNHAGPDRGAGLRGGLASLPLGGASTIRAVRAGLCSAGLVDLGCGASR